MQSQISFFATLLCFLFLLQSGLYPENSDRSLIKSRIFLGESVPDGQLAHAGVFSPDLMHYFLTLSDPEFRQFDVIHYVLQNGKWTRKGKAFFNSSDNEHGVAFSPDGKILFFSSTRPVTSVQGVSDTWHIWRCRKGKDGRWGRPEYVDIPNLRHKLSSHPSVTLDGTLYFHSANPDYSNMFIYRSEFREGSYLDAVKLPKAVNFRNRQNTPFVAADESYLLFESTPDIHLCFKDRNGNWGEAIRLPDAINRNGKGNPFITSDGKWLYFAAGEKADPMGRWLIYRTAAEPILEFKFRRRD